MAGDIDSRKLGKFKETVRLPKGVSGVNALPLKLQWSLIDIAVSSETLTPALLVQYATVIIGAVDVDENISPGF